MSDSSVTVGLPYNSASWAVVFPHSAAGSWINLAISGSLCASLRSWARALALRPRLQPSRLCGGAQVPRYCIQRSVQRAKFPWCPLGDAWVITSIPHLGGLNLSWAFNLQIVYLLRIIIKMLLLLRRAIYFSKCSQKQHFTSFTVCSQEATVPILEMGTPRRGYLNSKEMPSKVKKGLMRNSLWLVPPLLAVSFCGVWWESLGAYGLSSLKPQAAFGKPICSSVHLMLPSFIGHMWLSVCLN